MTRREIWYNVLILLYEPFEILGGSNMQSECNMISYQLSNHACFFLSLIVLNSPRRIIVYKLLTT